MLLLNPIRAGIAKTPENSNFTSIKQRIQHWQVAQGKQCRSTKCTERSHAKEIRKDIPPIPLMRLVKQRHDSHAQALGFSAKDYFELVDWAGRAIREDKRGAIPPDIPPILDRLKLNPKAYLHYVQFKRAHPRALGALDRLKALAQQLDQRFIRGQGALKELYRSTVTLTA